jgi:hypothetical protein
MYTIDENSLSVKDFTLILNSDSEIEISEDLKNKIFLCSNLLKTHFEVLDKNMNTKNYKEFEGNGLLNEREVRGIILATIYTLANGRSGVSYETIEKLIDLFQNRETIKIPEFSLSTKLDTLTPNHYLLNYVKDIAPIERKLLIKSLAYIPGFICSYFEDLQLVKKLLTISLVLYFNYPYMDSYNLASSPHLPFIKLAENINLFFIAENKNKNRSIDPLIFSYVSYLYKLLDDLQELLNIQLNSSHHPFIFIPENNTFIKNSLLIPQKLYLLKTVENLILTVDKTFESFLTKIGSFEDKVTIYNVFYSLKQCSDEILLTLKYKIKIYKKILAFILYEYAVKDKAQSLDQVLKSFMKEKNIKNYKELEPLLKDLLKTIEEKMNELY